MRGVGEGEGTAVMCRGGGGGRKGMGACGRVLKRTKKKKETGWVVDVEEEEGEARGTRLHE